MARGKTPRQKKERVYQSFTLQKTLPAKKTALRSPQSLLGDSFRLFRAHWLSFSLLAAFFLAAALILLFSAGRNDSLEQIKAEFSQRYGSSFSGELSTAFALLSESINALVNRLTRFFGWFVVLHLFASLSIWWLIRNLRDQAARIKVKVREAVYFGPAQIVPFTALNFLLLLQLLPALIVADFGLQLRENGVLQTNWEQAAVVAVIFIFFALSFYWSVGGLFSLIIVSLPGSKPLDALQTSLHLTHRRRRVLVGRLLFVPVILVLPAVLLALPAVWLLPQWSEHLLYLIGSLFFIINHIYFFLLYQNLLAAKTT